MHVQRSVQTGVEEETEMQTLPLVPSERGKGSLHPHSENHQLRVSGQPK